MFSEFKEEKNGEPTFPKKAKKMEREKLDGVCRRDVRTRLYSLVSLCSDGRSASRIQGCGLLSQSVGDAPVRRVGRIRTFYRFFAGCQFLERNVEHSDRQSHYASAEFPGSDSFCLVAQRGKT